MIKPNTHERYGYTARHVRCDGPCGRRFLPQHVHRVARFAWWCDNCIIDPPRNVGEGIVATLIEPEPRRRFHYDRLESAHNFPLAGAPPA